MNSFFKTGLRRLCGILSILVLSASAYAEDIRIDEVWTHAPASGRDYTNVFMFVTSNQDVAIVGASSPAAGAVELRSMIHKRGMMKTITLENIPLPAGKRVDMTSIHGYHLTLTGLKAPLKPGTDVPLTLELETADKLRFKADIKAEVRPLKSTAR